MRKFLKETPFIFLEDPPFWGQNFQRPFPLIDQKQNMLKTPLYSVYMHTKHIYFFYFDTRANFFETPFYQVFF